MNDDKLQGNTVIGAANERVTRWLHELEEALAAGALSSALDLFDEGECFWRDMIAFTWNIKTMEGKDQIAAFLAATLHQVEPGHFRIEGEARETDGITVARFVFETKVALGRGVLRLKGEHCWTILTTATALKGHEEKCGPAREMGVAHGAHKNRRTWLDRKTEEEAALGITRQPYCLVIGGGQGGLALAARLKRLAVSIIIVEKNARAGDSWRNRYKSLCLHDPVWYDHMPYLPFPDHWPVFSPKDKMGDWLEMYAKVMELNVWTSAECKSARFDEARKEWTVVVDRRGERVTLRPKQLVLATGMQGVPEVPKFPGADRFRGEQCHSSKFTSGERYRGKRCVVIGSNNSAHDICADLWEHDADVTMVQRSPTVVARAQSLMEVALRPLYSEEAVSRGISTDIADLTAASIPHHVTPRRGIEVVEEIRRRDRDLYEALDKVGFQYDFGEDGSGIGGKYTRRGAGYYIDVGACELVANGSIKLKSRVEVHRLTEASVVLSDGTELAADLVVYATGYSSMNGWAAQLISQEVADKVGKCWGVGSGTAKDPGPWEGELRNMWKPTRQEALWFHGGNLQQARFYSLILALQIKAREAGLQTPVYGLQQAHHLS
jgi:putative flavoprotein involved in K+ transport